MIYFGDYIGHILSELTLARAQADGETIRLAEFYADHELLKHFPVPRLRLEDVHLDIPVLVINVEDSDMETGPRGGTNFEDIAQVFDDLVNRHLKPSSLTEMQRNRTLATLSQQYKLLQKRRDTGLDAGGIAEKLTKVLSVELEVFNMPEAERNKLSAAVQLEARKAFQLRASPPARILVGVKSSEIKDANPEAVCRVSLKVGEDAVEWSVLDQDNGRAVLTPE